MKSVTLAVIVFQVFVCSNVVFCGNRRLLQPTAPGINSSGGNAPAGRTVPDAAVDEFGDQLALGATEFVPGEEVSEQTLVPGSGPPHSTSSDAHASERTGGIPGVAPAAGQGGQLHTVKNDSADEDELDEAAAEKDMAADTPINVGAKASAPARHGNGVPASVSTAADGKRSSSDLLSDTGTGSDDRGTAAAGQAAQDKAVWAGTSPGEQGALPGHLPDLPELDALQPDGGDDLLDESSELDLPAPTRAEGDAGGSMSKGSKQSGKHANLDATPAQDEADRGLDEPSAGQAEGSAAEAPAKRSGWKHAPTIASDAAKGAVQKQAEPGFQDESAAPEDAHAQHGSSTAWRRSGDVTDNVTKGEAVQDSTAHGKGSLGDEQVSAAKPDRNAKSSSAPSRQQSLDEKEGDVDPAPEPDAEVPAAAAGGGTKADKARHGAEAGSEKDIPDMPETRVKTFEKQSTRPGSKKKAEPAKESTSQKDEDLDTDLLLADETKDKSTEDASSKASKGSSQPDVQRKSAQGDDITASDGAIADSISTAHGGSAAQGSSDKAAGAHSKGKDAVRDDSAGHGATVPEDALEDSNMPSKESDYKSKTTPSPPKQAEVDLDAASDIKAINTPSDEKDSGNKQNGSEDGLRGAPDSSHASKAPSKAEGTGAPAAEGKDDTYDAPVAKSEDRETRTTAGEGKAPKSDAPAAEADKQQISVPLAKGKDEQGNAPVGQSKDTAEASTLAGKNQKSSKPAASRSKSPAASEEKVASVQKDTDDVERESRTTSPPSADVADAVSYNHGYWLQRFMAGEFTSISVGMVVVAGLLLAGAAFMAYHRMGSSPRPPASSSSAAVLASTKYSRVADSQGREAPAAEWDDNWGDDDDVDDAPAPPPGTAARKPLLPTSIKHPAAGPAGGSDGAVSPPSREARSSTAPRNAEVGWDDDW